MADPASVNLSLSVTGLSNAEAVCALENAPAGSTFSAEVTQPAIGGKRYTVRTEGLSLLGAKDLATALHLFFEQQAGGGAR